MSFLSASWRFFLSLGVIMDIEHSEEYNQYYAFVDRSEALKQHGVLGMKWGVRRYQYKDGSLTPDGRIHYVLKRKRKINPESKRKNNTKASKTVERISKRDIDFDNKWNRWDAHFQGNKNEDGYLGELKESSLLDIEKEVFDKLDLPIDFLKVDEYGEIVRKDGRPFEGRVNGKTRSYKSLYELGEDYENYKTKDGKSKLSVIWDGPGSIIFINTHQLDGKSPAHYWNYFDKNYAEFTKNISDKDKNYADLVEKAIQSLEKEYYRKEVIERGETARSELNAIKNDLKDKNEKKAYAAVFRHPEYFTDSTGQWRINGKDVTLDQLIKILSKDDFINEYV